jgi:hypothetical protein
MPNATGDEALEGQNALCSLECESTLVPSFVYEDAQHPHHPKRTIIPIVANTPIAILPAFVSLNFGFGPGVGVYMPPVYA